MSPSISVVIVAYDSADDLARTLPALAAELDARDQVIVVDNGSTDPGMRTETRAVVGEHLESALLVQMGRNAGFAAAVNEGASQANGDLLLILNPDARPMPGFVEAIRRPFESQPGWAAWMGLVTYEEGGRRLVNSAGNPVHFTGIVWAGGHGAAIEHVRRGAVVTASGACLAVRRDRWLEAGGFPREFFLYHEDVDLSIRLRLAGWQVGIEPEAKVDHDYEFGGRPEKWMWLERNRLAFLVRCYPLPVLLAVLPALLATELVLVPVAASQGWLTRKLRAWRDFALWLPRLVAERREIQASRTISASAFADLLTPDLDSPFISPAARSPLARTLLRGYWVAARALVRAVG